MTLSNVLIAGQPQSGSTKLFNMVRIALERSGVEVNTFLFSPEDGWPSPEPGRVNLAKVHNYDAVAADGAGLVLTTRRDIRDCVVSHIKRLKQAGHGSGPWTPFYYGVWNLECYKAWQQRSDAEFVYEDGVIDARKQAAQLGDILQIELSDSDCEELIGRVDSLWNASLPEFDDKSNAVYQKTLLTASHNTSGGRVGNYKRFDMDWREFNFIFARYFRECGYEVGPMQNTLSKSWHFYAMAAVEFAYQQIAPARNALRQGLALFEQEYAPFKNFVKMNEKISRAEGRRPAWAHSGKLIWRGWRRGFGFSRSDSGASRLLEDRRRKK